MASGDASSSSSSLYDNGLITVDQDRRRRLATKLYDLVKSYESPILHVQRLLVWEKPHHSCAFFFLVNLVFWYMVLNSDHVIGVCASLLLSLFWIDLWKHRIWPEICVRPPVADDEWGELHPQLLSVFEMCELLSDVLLIAEWTREQALDFRAKMPGKFCLVFSSACIVLSTFGNLIPGVLLAYFSLLVSFFWPLIWYHKLLERGYTRMEPYFMQLQYMLRQRPGTTYRLIQSMKPRTRSSRSSLSAVVLNSSSNEESVIDEFVPQLDEKTAEVLARAITDDSELSETDEEILAAQEIPSFSRSTTPDPFAVSNDSDAEYGEGEEDEEPSYIRALPKEMPANVYYSDSDEEGGGDGFGIPQFLATRRGRSPAEDQVSSTLEAVLQSTMANLMTSSRPTGGSNDSSPSSEFEILAMNDPDIVEYHENNR